MIKTDTPTAILITQLPIAIGIIICAFLLHDVKNKLIRILEHLSRK